MTGMNNPVIDQCGTKRWFNENGKLHREDGPAVVYTDGTKHWYRDGLLRREDGPAVEYADGTKRWCRDGLLHREDGPVIEYPDGAKLWKAVTGPDVYYPEFGCFDPKSRQEALDRLNSKPRPFSYDLYMADIDRMFPEQE